MREEIAKTFGISKQQLKIFFLAFLAMFIISSLQYLGVRSPWKPMQLTLPIPAQPAGVMDTIQEKLEEKPNNFSLKETPVLVPQTYAASEMDQLTAYAVIDIDTGEIITEKNGKDRLPIASITKIMTAVVGLDLVDPSELFTIDEDAAAMVPTKIGIVPGEKMTFEELLKASLLTSANDATQQIKNSIDKKYEENIFIKAMNHKATFLGLTNTHFANAMGFDDPENYSSAEDLARLAQYALANYPKFAEIVEKDSDVLMANENHKQFDLYNWNGLIGVYPDTHGVKIGNTGKAGKTTLVYSNRGGKRLVAVVLGAPGIKERDLWAAKLLDIGYERTLGLKPINVTEEQLQAKYSTWQYWN
jgi:D-alanyl-D-alanine carboxypeptidase